MNFETVTNIDFQAAKVDNNLVFTFVDTDTLLPIGTLTMKAVNAVALLSAIQEVARELHSSEDVNNKALTKFDDGQGTIAIRDA